MSLIDSKYAALARLVDGQLAAAPEQEKFLTRRLSNLDEHELASLNVIAGNVEKLIGEALDVHTRDYAWLCGEQIQEELNFRRTGRYRINTFEEALRDVYSNTEYMTRYMNGLLMTQLWWSNHSKVMEYYTSHFLANNKAGYSHLEIGPGHGLFLYLAAADPRSGDVIGWDISEASIAMTAEALRKLGLSDLPRLELRDLFAAPQGSFDSVVFSEVLEHMEKPEETLKVLRALLSPEGRLFINMPINSPAPDHLFNMPTPEALEQFIVDAGFRVIDHAFFPATNQTLEACRKKALTISCAFVLSVR